jgi:hypothetical protein
VLVEIGCAVHNPEVVAGEGDSMKVPKRRSSRKYKEVVEKGCGLRYYEYEGDYDCDHKYEWNCEDCPCALEGRREREKQLQKWSEGERDVDLLVAGVAIAKREKEDTNAL